MAKPKYPQSEALELARLNAIRMLGLHERNTPEDRARAMGFKTPAYHASDADIHAFDNLKLGENTRRNTGNDSKAVKSAMSGHWFSDRDLTNKDSRGYMFGDVSYPVMLAKHKAINDKEFGSKSYIVKDPAQVRSRFAAFDPARAHEAGLSYAQGGTVADSEFDNDDVQDSRRVAESKAMLNPKVQTVRNPQRMAFPGIYKNPKDIAAEAAARVEPEDPSLKRLFGVTREDLFQMGKGRKGNLPGTLPGAAAKPRGSEAAAKVMTPENEKRIIDVLSEAEKHHALIQGMDPWYIMDPVFQRMAQLIGKENAIREYDKLNHLMGMASPASEVMTEIPRGTAAYMMSTQGRFADFLKHAGKAEDKRTRSFPADIRNVPGHAYHKTAQAGPMDKYLTSGQMTMKTPKVPLYIKSSGVPETGFQTETPVGDAHWSRGVGLADTRNRKMVKGREAIPGASVTNPEMTLLAPWWREQIAAKLGLESGPAQARSWGTFAPQTGVDTPIGAGKLELLARNIMMTAHRLGVTPETARDLLLTGKAYAGKAEGGAVEYADGGSVEPDKDTMLASLMLRKAPNLMNIKDVGVNEAPDLPIKAFVSPNGGNGEGLPIGGVDFQPLTPGNQMMPMQPGQPQGGPPPGQPPMPGQPPQAGMPPPGAPGAPPPRPGQPQSNILALTPQGQAMQAMRPNPQAMPQRPGPTMPKMAGGGQPPVEDMRKALGKLLEGSHTPMRLYHGTTATEGGKGNEAIRRFKPSKEGALGAGVYLTPDASHASGYSGIPNDDAILSMLANEHHHDTGLKALRQRDSGNVLPSQQGGNMLPVHARILNPLVLHSKGAEDPMILALTQLGVDRDKANKIVEKAYEEKGGIGNQVKTRAQAAGHDAIMQYRDGKLTEVVHWNPRMIKSAIGNRGTYDTTKDDLSMKRGGSTHDIQMTERPL